MNPSPGSLVRILNVVYSDRIKYIGQIGTLLKYNYLTEADRLVSLVEIDDRKIYVIELEVVYDAV